MTEQLIHATAGSVASGAAMILMYPLDRLKIILQVQAGHLEDGNRKQTPLEMLRTFYEKEGIQGYYRGLTPVVQTVTISQFIYFYFFEGLKKLCPEGPSGLLLASSIAGVLNMALTEPFWKASVQLQSRSIEKGESRKSRKSRSLLAQVRHLVRQEGLASQWNGFPISFWLTSNPVIQFFAYDSLKAALKRGRNVSNFEAFFLGMIAKGIATFFTYPLQIAQAQLRAKNTGHTSMVGCLTSIVDSAGLPALFSGFWPKMSQTSLTAAFMFLFYERIVNIVMRARRRRLKG
eukprot:GEMP01034956.1.p1 GENE.GEMP01034956.1~~GEMP01034956.1.p1  ORF type:complete len:290 (+),score=39.85 GEMP01034956.1:38-907(+)